ncbi:MAG: response regulator transcription factor, partial [Pseudomonadota bacterium]
MQRILIIDDHPIFRHAMTSVLSQRFHQTEVKEADSIENAMQLLEDDSNFDLVMLDLNMPDSSGLNGLLDLRNNYPSLPVVIISAETEKQNILQTISYGAVGFISKASSIDEIATSIESIFAGNVCLPSDILRQ